LRRFQKLKPLFIGIYPLLAATTTLVAAGMLLTGHWSTVWLGGLLASVPFVGLFLKAVMLRSMARTSSSLPLLAAMTAAGGALALWGYVREENPSLTGLVLTLLCVAGFFLFDFWYSSFGRRINEQLAAGRQLPDFECEDMDGNPVGPADLAGAPVLYMFYRGNWCPFCEAQVKELTACYRALIDRGVEVVLISPQPPDLTRRVAEFFNVPFRFWVDRDLRAARALDIVDEFGVPGGKLAQTHGAHTVMPTVIITDADGRIVFTDQTETYRVRPEPEVFLRVIDAHGLGHTGS
jgi:peroxiredoxin